jgi:hypothetical protein
VIDQHRVLGVIAPTPGGPPALHLREDLTGTQRLRGAGLDAARVRAKASSPQARTQSAGATPHAST